MKLGHAILVAPVALAAGALALGLVFMLAWNAGAVGALGARPIGLGTGAGAVVLVALVGWLARWKSPVRLGTRGDR